MYFVTWLRIAILKLTHFLLELLQTHLPPFHSFHAIQNKRIPFLEIFDFS